MSAGPVVSTRECSNGCQRPPSIARAHVLTGAPARLSAARRKLRQRSSPRHRRRKQRRLRASRLDRSSLEGIALATLSFLPSRISFVFFFLSRQLPLFPFCSVSPAGRLSLQIWKPRRDADSAMETPRRPSGRLFFFFFFIFRQFLQFVALVAGGGDAC